MSTLYIKRVTLRGFKSIEELTTDLKPGLNILIGKNGAGKSNFLGFLKIVIQSVISPRHANFKAAKVLFSTPEQQDFVYTITRNSSKAVTDEPDTLKYVKTLKSGEEYLYNSGSAPARNSLLKGGRLNLSRSMSSIFNRMKVHFRNAKFIEFNTSEDLDGLSTPLSLEISFDYDSFWAGGNGDTLLLSGCISGFELQLIAKLNALDTAEEENEEETNEKWNEVLSAVTTESFLESAKLNQQVIEDLRKFTPVENVRLNKAVSIFRNDTELIIENIRLDFFVNGNWLPWNQLSDGTKRMFLLVSEISQTISGVILVEEPELGIHPHQFTLVMQFLKEQAATKQVILSTHSPKALDILDIEELDSILIAEYEKGKGTVITKMSDEQKEKATAYVHEVGFLSDFWLMSDLEL